MSRVGRFGSVSNVFLLSPCRPGTGRPFPGSLVHLKPALMTLKEFAVHLGVSYSTVRRMVADKTVRVVRPHRRAMIPVSEAEKFTSL